MTTPETAVVLPQVKSCRNWIVRSHINPAALLGVNVCRLYQKWVRVLLRLKSVRIVVRTGQIYRGLNRFLDISERASQLVELILTLVLILILI